MIRYFRFAVNGAAGYDAMRAAGDLSLSLSGSNTCIEPAATAPIDTKGRILLAVNTASVVYPAILPSLNALINSTACEEISAADYWASFEQVIATGGGGGVSSWNDLTDKPTSFPPSEHTQAATTVTVATTFSYIAPAFANVESALGSIDSAFDSLQTQVSTASDYGVQGYVSILPNSGLTVIGGDLSVAFGTTSTTVCRGSDSRLSNSRTPTGAAGGSLAGTYPNPTIAAGAVATASLADGAVTIAKTTGIQKAITSGTAAPSGGSPGDIYLRYSP